jgi:hypothetical protein
VTVDLGANPHGVLGAHEAEDGVVVRTLQPEAQAVRVQPAGIEAELKDPAGLWEALLPKARLPLDYELEVEYPDGSTFTVRDPYSFLPTLGELDLHLAMQGRHEHLYERLVEMDIEAFLVRSTLAAILAQRLVRRLCQQCKEPYDATAYELQQIGIDPERIHLVGNTMIDSVLRHLPVALARRPWLRFGVEPEGFALVTLHRPALVDDAHLLRQTVDALIDLGELLPVIFPVHPRTEARLAAAGLDSERLGKQGLKVCAPLGYLDFLALEAKAAFVLTDSGGIQEETSALGVRCFTLRDTTERPVTVELGTNVILGMDPDRIRTIPQLLKDVTRPPGEIPLWDGRAGGRAAGILNEFLSPPDSPRRKRAVGELSDLT